MGAAHVCELDLLGSPQFNDAYCKYANKIWVLVKAGNTPNGRAASSFVIRTVRVHHVGTH